MIPEVMAASLVAGWLRGGRFSRLADLRIRHWWLIYAAVFLYVVALALISVPATAQYTVLFRAMFILSRTLLLMLAVYNLTISGVRLIFLGMLLNFLAIVANAGQMQVSESALKTVFGAGFDFSAMPHVQSTLATASTRLYLLCDIIPFSRPYVFVPGVYSIGDLVMSAGLSVAIVTAMRARRVSGNAAN